MDVSWRHYFDQLNEKAESVDVNHSDIKKYFKKITKNPSSIIKSPINIENTNLSLKVVRLVDAYRRLGHYQASVNPLKYQQLNNPTELSLDFLWYR